MSNMNVDPIATFSNGSQLMVSTQHSGNDSFTCELFEASQDPQGRWNLQVVSNHLEASTCLGAQTIAYDYAKRLYPTSGVEMKQPPYLIWVGPGIRASMSS